MWGRSWTPGLEPFWAWLLGTLLGLDLDAGVESAVMFFCLDAVKIVLLLVGIIFVVTVLRSY